MYVLVCKFACVSSTLYAGLFIKRPLCCCCAAPCSYARVFLRVLRRLTRPTKVAIMQSLRWLPGLCGSLGPALIPPAHIAVLWYFWQNYARFVDRRFCSCSCWDTVFKGTYESGIASYKHMYFNATQNTLKIWMLVVVGIISLYECSKALVFLVLMNKVRYTMIVLFALSIFSHYYGWWAYINYYNDEFYSQWNHQLFFTVMENGDAEKQFATLSLIYWRVFLAH